MDNMGFSATKHLNIKSNSILFVGIVFRKKFQKYLLKEGFIFVKIVG